MSRGARAATQTTTVSRPAPRGHSQPDPTTRPFRLDTGAPDQRALQAGIALARRHAESTALAEAGSGAAVTALTAPLDIGRITPLVNRAGELIAADLERLKQVVSGISAMQTMHPLLEAEEQRRQRLAKMINPCRELIEGLRIQSFGLDRVAEGYQASLRRMAEAVEPRFPAIECNLGLDAISKIAAFGKLGLDDPQGPMRIHAVPRLAFSAAHRRDRQHAQASPPEQIETGAVVDPTSEDSRKLLKQLLPFLQSDEIPSKTRESMSALIDWWQLNQHGITPEQNARFNRIVLNLIHAQLGLATSDGEQRQLSSGLLVPQTRNAAPPPDLAPEMFTTKDLNQQLHASIDTFKRHARKACKKGPLPQPLADFPDWFVVVRSDPQGGQNRGWKFQKLRTKTDS